MPLIEFPPAGVTDVSQSPYLQRLIRSGRIVGGFVTVQVIVQIIGFLSGILLIRVLDQREYAFFTIANTMQGILNLLADIGISIGLVSIGGRVWQDRTRFSELIIVLHVGSGLRRKNRDGVLRIFAKTKDRWDAQLVFAGDALSNELWTLAHGLNISDRIVELGSVGSELLEALYNCAHALLFPSRFEGFGWPIAEAQACGCPVLCRDAPAMSDVAGDAALVRGVEDEDGFADDLLRLRDPAVREKYRALGLQNATRFGARKMAEQYLALYRNLGATA